MINICEYFELSFFRHNSLELSLVSYDLEVVFCVCVAYCTCGIGMVVGGNF